MKLLWRKKRYSIVITAKLSKTDDTHFTVPIMAIPCRQSPHWLTLARVYREKKSYIFFKNHFVHMTHPDSVIHPGLTWPAMNISALCRELPPFFGRSAMARKIYFLPEIFSRRFGFITSVSTISTADTPSHRSKLNTEKDHVIKFPPSWWLLSVRNCLKMSFLTKCTRWI